MRRSRWISYIVIIAVVIALGLNAYITEKRHMDEKAQYIRFHVIANSDSSEDQELKLRVRNALLERFRDEFEKIDSIEDSRRLIKENLCEIENIAKEEVRRSGKTYRVQAQLGHFSFPTKAYGNLVLPAGQYEALRVVIGEGNGANWWCVMFPPLCFVDATHGIAREKVEDAHINIKTSFSSTSRKEVRIEYRFKIAEWWERLLSFLNIGRR